MLVSVIIPTYNRKKLLDISINSVLNQTYQNFEIIIVDDNSNDGTDKYIKEINHHKIHYIKNKQTMYAPKSRNIGISYSKGDLISFLDDDDEWYPDKLEKQVKLFSDINIGLVYSGIDLFFEDYNLSYPTSPKLRGSIYKDMLIKNYIGATSSVIIRRDVLNHVCTKKHECFDPAFPARQDYDLWIRITEKWKVNFIYEPTVKQYYRNSINRISRNLDNHIKAHELLNQKYNRNIDSILSYSNKKERLINQYLFLAAQSIKINERKLATKYYLEAFKIKRDIKSLAMCFVSFFGVKLMIKLRSWF
tara:strand:+ start:2214 stop:3128 length:915 start_codon:yes stop_codon:yes gene_type:complete